MDNELDLSRYAAGLRRHRILIACVALVGLVAGIVYALRSDYKAVIQVQAAPKVLDLVAVGLEPDEFNVDRLIDVMLAEANQDNFDEELSDETSADVDITADRHPERPRITVSIASSSEEAAAEAADIATERLRERYVAEFTTDVSRVRSGTAERIATNTEQLAAVDAQLASAGPEQQSLVEGLLVERQRLTDRIEGLDAVVAALDRFESDLGSDLRRTTQQEPERSSPVVLGALGLIGGLALAIGLSLARTALDRTIRTRRDLAKVGVADLVGVVPAPPSELAVNSARRAVNSLARSIPTQAIQIVPIGDRADLTWMDQLNGTSASATITVHPPITVAADAVEHASDTGLSILAVQWGRDSRFDVVRAANELSAAGAAHVAVLLFGVPAGEISGVER